MSTKIWYRDLSSAFGRDNAHRFIPLRTMSLTQQLNAAFRLSVYYSVLMTLLTRRTSHMTAAVVVAVVTAAVHELSARETFWAGAPDTCVQPSKGNPFMNLTLADLELRPTRTPACPKSKPVDKRPPTDGPYDEMKNDRFYTMPVTTAVNDQEGFARALYGGRQSNAPGARA